tara:strand:- start:156 stop:503 length:348 start_codon:yes stop_codon:yes gene_type:complete
MALALNIFKTETKIATLTPSTVYVAPVGYTGVILLAQVTNIDPNTTYEVSFSHQRTKSGIAITTEIVKDYPIPPREASNLLFGKMVLESNDKLLLSSNNSGNNIKLILSILETLN